MTAAPRCASPIQPVRDAHLALGGHPCARPPLAPSACPIGPLASSAPLPHRPLASSAPYPFGAGVLGMGRAPATRTMSGRASPPHRSHACAMDEPCQEHDRAPESLEQRNKDGTPAAPAEASVARSRGLLRAAPAPAPTTAPTRPHQAAGLAPIPRRRPTPLPAVVPPGGDRCGLRSRRGNGG